MANLAIDNLDEFLKYCTDDIKFIFSSSFPNEFTAITASPFPWMEASYRYTEIKNKRYSSDPTFSGNQTWKDKGFDLKLRLLKESYYVPSLAVGFMDIAGTGTFASEYLAFTKSFGVLDLTAGLGWGNLGRGGDLHYNPFISILGDKYKSRISSNQGQGGDFNLDAYFSGPAALFGGLEYYAKKYNINDDHIHITEGDPDDVVEVMAKEIDADLVVIGSIGSCLLYTSDAADE